MGEDTKRFIKDVFGENFAKNFNLFEKKIKELYNQNEKLSKELQQEVILTSALNIFFLAN